MKPYLRGGVILLLAVLGGCVSAPPGGDTAETPVLPAVSQPLNTAGASEISGPRDTVTSGAAEEAIIVSAESASEPPAPPAADIPLPEWTAPDLPEPFLVFPHIIHVDPLVSETASPTPAAQDLGEEPAPEDSAVGAAVIAAKDPAPAVSSAAVASGPVPDTPPGAARVTSGSTASPRGGSASPPVLEAGADSRSFSLPGWKSVETREERVYAPSERDPHILMLEGSGWTLQSSQGVHVNLQRTLQPGITVFSFLLPREGEGFFIFQRQDLSGKLLYQKTVSYRSEVPPEPPVYSAETDAREGEDQQTIPAAQEAAPQKAPDDQEVLSEEDPSDLPPSVLTGPGMFDESTDSDILFNEAVRFYNGEDYHSLAKVLDLLQHRNLPFWEQDRLLLFLGRLYDLKSPLRDERAALGYYSRLVEQFPGSLYWEEANRRARYIQRHFFQIR